MPEDSCWGCGRDYLHCWTEDDLVDVVIDDSQERVCPDCHEELVLQGMLITGE
jgi:hypothetical protein